MSQNKEGKKRQPHSDEFKEEALKLAEQIGFSKAAEQLGLASTQLYTWRSKAKAVANESQRDRELAAENARLKRELAKKTEEIAILKNASAYFARNLK